MSTWALEGVVKMINHLSKFYYSHRIRDTYNAYVLSDASL